MAKQDNTVASKPQISANIQQNYCRKCEKMKVFENFYDATNQLLDSNGKMSICSACCQDVYDHFFKIYGNLRDAIHNTCRELDIRFNEHTLIQAQSHIERNISNGRNIKAVFGIYKSKLSSLGKSNEQMEDLRYKYGDFASNEKITIDDNSPSRGIELPDSEFELTENIVRYWGQGKEEWEYELLEEEKFRLQTDFECTDYGMEMIMRDICFINLDIERIRQGFDKGDITKLIDARSKLMNDGNLKPVQSTGADKNEKVSFGVFIKKWENERPVSTTLDDEMKRYIDTYMVGHLAKMEGLNNDTVRKYEEAIKEFSVDFQDINRDEVDGED